MDLNTLQTSALDFLTAPLAISEAGLRYLAKHALQARDGQPLQATRSMEMRGSVAVLPACGPLMRRDSVWSRFFGANSYEAIRKDLQVALENTDVKAVIFDFDTPGGEVAACGELSLAIYEARKIKPVYAYASGQMCSAGYWIGSACDEIWVDPSAMLGSIGVRTALVDWSKFNEKVGIQEFDIVSTQSPYKVVDASEPDDRKRVRDTMTAMASVFIADVARNRAVSEGTVLADFGQGDVLIGKKAVAAGLADRVGDFESLLSELGASMKIDKKPGAVNASVSSGKCSGCSKAMDDDDDMYCDDCGGSDASAAIKQVLALTSKPSAIEAIGVVTAWKELAGEASALKAQLAQQAVAAEAAAFDTEIAKAKASGLLAQSDEHKRNKAVLAYKGQPKALDSLRSFLGALDPLSAPAATAGVTAVQKQEPAKAPTAVSELTPAQIAIITASGSTPEKFIAHQQVLARLINPAVAAEEK